MVDDLALLPRLAMFSAVVDAGGFAAAGRVLGVTRAAVSKSVRQLESDLGVRLLQRTTRRCTPTEAGRLVYPRARELVEAADAAVLAGRSLSAEPVGALVVAAPMGIAEHLVAPVLPEFLARHGAVQVELRVSDRSVDLVADGVDVAIRAGRLPDSALRARKLTELDLQLVAAPGYLGARVVETPADLDGHHWVVFAPLPERMPLTRGQERHTIRMGGSVVTDSGAAMARLVQAGAGLGLLPDFYAAPGLASGALVRLLPDYRVPAGGVYALHGFEGNPPLKVRAFIDHLVRAVPTLG